MSIVDSREPAYHEEHEIDLLTRRTAELGQRVGQLESLVSFMVPFFESACSRECGCPDAYFVSHECEGGCAALEELRVRMGALGLQEAANE